MSDIVLNAQSLSKTYAQADGEPLNILKNFSCDVKAGEIVALVGPSGSGKSTLLHILGLLDRADSGSLVINDRDVLKLSDGERTKIRRNDMGFVYQFHHLLAEFSAIENITLPQIINGVGRKDARARAMDLLTQLKLDHRADNRPAKLSGGEQQRVAIARALANNPSMILADEPTGNLDPETSDIVFNMMMDVVRGQKIGALIATHNMDLAKRMDRIIQF